MKLSKPVRGRKKRSNSQGRDQKLEELTVTDHKHQCQQLQFDEALTIGQEVTDKPELKRKSIIKVTYK